MNDFCDLLGTPYAPVSKIAPVKFKKSEGSHQILTPETVAFTIP
jgi:hypothetical protein